MTTKPATLDIPTNLDYSDPIAVAKVIRTALRARSGKTWSVRNDRGTAWGWLTIRVPDSRADNRDELRELNALFGVSGTSNCIGVADTPNHRREYVALACGHVPTVHGVAYWD